MAHGDLGGERLLGGLSSWQVGWSLAGGKRVGGLRLMLLLMMMVVVVVMVLKIRHSSCVHAQVTLQQRQALQ